MCWKWEWVRIVFWFCYEKISAKASYGEQEWYFFSPRDRKYPNGARPNRAATSGYWKATGTDKPVIASSEGNRKVGVKKALVFYGGKPPRGIKTNWIMHEYRLADNNLGSGNNNKPRGFNIGGKKNSLRVRIWNTEFESLSIFILVFFKLMIRNNFFYCFFSLMIGFCVGFIKRPTRTNRGWIMNEKIALIIWLDQYRHRYKWMATANQWRHRRQQWRPTLVCILNYPLYLFQWNGCCNRRRGRRKSIDRLTTDHWAKEYS